MGRSGGGGGGFSSGGHGGGSHHVQVSAAVAVAFAAVVHAEAVLAVVQGLTVPVRDLDHTTITVRGHITIMEVRACHHLHHREEDIMEAEQLTYIQTAVAAVHLLL